MADGVAITAGSGTTILTDETGTGHAQVVKLAISTDGSATLIPAEATNGLDVDVTRVQGTVTVTGSGGTFPVTDSGGSLTVDDGAGSLTVDGTVTVVGDLAHDAASDTGNSIKNGGKAESSPAGITLVSDGDRTDYYADVDGLQMIKPYTAYGDILVERTTNTDGAATALSTFGATASARNFVTTITVYNSSTTNGFLDLRDGTGGTVIYTIPLPALGGATINFPVPLRQPTANTALAYDASAALSTVYISLVGFKSKA